MFKAKLRKAFRSIGLDIRALKVSTDSALATQRLMELLQINLLLDVGANSGQYAKGIRKAGYTGKIVSLEPQSEAHEKLERSAHRDAMWVVHSRTAIGDFDGKTVLNISQNSVSSSILPILNSHTAAESSSTYVSTEETPICQIDSISSAYFSADTKCLLKIDVQGYEWQVLSGAVRSFSRIDGIVCEMSLSPLYTAQHLWGDIITLLETLGFSLWAIYPGFTDPNSGRTLQLDGVFIKSDSDLLDNNGTT